MLPLSRTLSIQSLMIHGDKPYVYQCPSEHSMDFDLYSYGQDGAQGGEGYDKDIVNWDEAK